MESATTLTPPSTGLICFSSEPNIPEGPEYGKYQHYIDVRGEALPTPHNSRKTSRTHSSDFNPFKQNGFSHSNQMDQSISILRVVVLQISFLPIYTRIYFACCVVRRQVWFYTDCICL